MITVSPSLLAADFGNLQKEITLVQDQADWLHLDIMDGHFVPNISYGFPIINAIRRVTKLPLDVHLMIEDPDKYLDKFIDAGADMITVHVEACTHLHRTVSYIKAAGCMVGVALNPHTPLSTISYVLDEVDLVLIMSVNPGFGGQSFITQMISKIKDLHQMLNDQCQSETFIAVDGGINMSTAQLVVQAGADFLIAGSAIFKASDPVLAIEQLKSVK